MDWIQVAQTFGLPVVCMIALSTAVWKIGVWVAKNLLKPAMDRHLKFVDQVAGKLDGMSDSVHEMAAIRTSDQEHQTKVMDSLGSMVSELGRVTKGLEGVTVGLTELKQLVIKADNVTVVPPGKASNVHDPSR